MAGLLTHPLRCAFPSSLSKWSKHTDSGKNAKKHLKGGKGLTAAGTVPDFHRVPFSTGPGEAPPVTTNRRKYMNNI